MDNLFVRAVRSMVDGDPRRGLAAPALDRADADADAIRRTVREARAVASARTAHLEMTSAHRHTTGTVAGVSPDWARIANLKTTRGRWFGALDHANARRVAVAGSTGARQLFGAGSAVGAEVLVGGTWYWIVGVLEDPAARTAKTPSLQRLDPAESLFVPIAAMDLSLGRGDERDRVEEIAVQAVDADSVEVARAAADRVLTRRHGAGAPDYDVIVPRALLNARLRAERSFDWFVLSIGGLTLLIGGIGIMNVMLTVVSERAAEIGVRRAVGATARHIVAQFTAEAGLIAAAGAAAGIPAGVMMSFVVAVSAGWPFAVSVSSMAVALLLAVGTGLGCGIYPAWRAARLDPVALRAD